MTTNNRNLTLTTVGQNVTINVTYNAVFTPFERHLADLGMVFQERIRVLGIDPPGSTTGTILSTLPLQNYPVTNGNVQQVIARNRSVTVTRAFLQEDLGLGDADEIRCRIEMVPLGFPTETAQFFTDQEVLLG